MFKQSYLRPARITESPLSGFATSISDLTSSGRVFLNRRLSPYLLLLLLCSPVLAKAQTGGHTLFGDIKIEENKTSGLKPIFVHVLLYSEDGHLVSRQSVASNGRYRFNDLRNGRYDVVVEVENTEIARVRVFVNAPFKTDFRQDLEFQWTEKSSTGRAEVVSAADLYNRSTTNAAWFRKAAAASQKRRFDEAIILLRQIVESDPKDFPAWTELGTMYFIQKDFDEAEKIYTEALRINPDYVVALICFGRVRIVRQDYQGAIVALTHAVQLQPTSAQANYFLGEAYLQEKLGSKAVRYLNEAVRLDPEGMAEAHLRLAALYHARNLRDKAAAEYEAFLKLRPDYPYKKELKEYIAANKKL